MTEIKKIKSLLAEIPPEFKRGLLISHNSDLKDLLIFLVGEKNAPNTDKLLPTAAMARLVMPDDWSQLSTECVKLLSITYAKTLTLKDRE